MMKVLVVLAWFSGLAGAVGTGVLIWWALAHRSAGDRRAAGRFGAVAVLWALVSGAGVLVPAAAGGIGVALLLLAAGVLFPRGRTVGKPLPTPEPYDERDTLFSRNTYLPGTEAYRDYYCRHRERRETDDELREMPGLGEEGTLAYDPAAAALMHSSFELTGEMHSMVEAGAGHDPVPGEDGAELIRTAARHWGACTVGFARLEKGDIYSHVGRRREEYGRRVSLDHTSAVVLGVQMRYSAVAAAPSLVSTAESARAYLEAAVIALGMVRIIGRLGWSARAHIDGSYQVAASPIAARAGLGEIGRSGLLVTEEWGPRVRLAVVTTDMPLPHGQPISFGLEEFCRVCGRCAHGCPARAIEGGPRPRLSRGVRKWTVDGERCYRYWRTIGSDCGLCLKTCPYSRPDAEPIRALRRLVRRRPLVARAVLRAYSFVYGRAPGARLKGIDAHDTLTRER